MGQAILYCSNCSAQLRGSDFDARKAFKVDDLVFCAKCCQEILGKEAPVPASSTSTRIKAVLPAKVPSSTNRIPIVVPPPDSGSSAGLYVGLGVAAVVILIVVAAMSGGDRPAPPPPSQNSGPMIAPTPPAAPRPSVREIAAQEALAKALRTENLETRRVLLVEAVAQAAGTSLYPDAQRELERVERKLNEQKAAEAPKTAPLVKPVEPPPTPPTPAPSPTPQPPDRSREEAAQFAKWEAALSPATGRDYAAAIAALEKLGTAGPDIALLKTVSTRLMEALVALSRTTKGQKLALDYRDGAGELRRVESFFMENENGRVELRNDSTTVEVEVGEITPSSLVDLLRSRGAAMEPVPAAVFCLLEGDEAGARRLAGTAEVPDRFWTFGRKVARADAARALFQEALTLENNFATAADAAPKYQALLRDHAESPFVKRNKISITARGQQCGRDYLFATPDLKSAGTFKSLKAAKGFVCWTSEADSDPAKLKDNFIELSYSVLADTAYKCWIYAGGCCQETFEFGAQGTEMKSGRDKEAVEPGSGVAATIKPWASSLKKTHAAHTGPKQPVHWEWIAIPLPKYSKSGLQQVRVLTNQKGFSVAFACVSATRTAPPRESEMKEIEKTRGSVAVAAPGIKTTVLYAPALDGNDKHLIGEFRDKALHGIFLYNSSFAGYEGPPVFTVPAQGEFRMTYSLKTVTPLQVRFRVHRGEGKSDAYDAVVPDPVAGRPTEVRLPMTAFKPMAGFPLPPMAAGDSVRMIYIIGADPNCGLRLDAFSVLEIKKEEVVRTPAATGKVLFSENFDAGPGKFNEGEWADGGVKGTKGYLMTYKGASCWGPWNIPAKDTVIVSFKVKPLGDVGSIMVLVWSDKLNDNGRFQVTGLNKGEWKEVRIKATDFHIGASGEGQSIDMLNNIKMFLLGSAAEVKVLLDDFEIRE